MKHTLTAACCTLAALLAAPAVAEMDISSWHIGYLDANGESTDLRGAYSEVAYARGSRGYVLEVLCAPANNNRIFRLSRRVADREKFGGDTFPVSITVRTGDKIEFEQESRELSYNEEGMYYQGRLAQRIGNALAKGNRLVFESPERENFRTGFTLNGSAKAIGQIDCE
ncbi:hypothetical protein [Oceanibium sediminis]|uniref:hypothetical protein n=1 Tax=Oceanibium sediminis TaxID=2026339 RepID=UPI000DD3C343|nr:hypothetical protein [Oceanibium sediminis]